MDIKRLTSSFTSCFFPDYCFLCKNNLLFEEYILCSECVKLLEPVPVPRCSRCGYPRVKVNCPCCRRLKPVFNESYQLFQFSESVRKLIHLWKYSEQVRLTEYFARLMVELTPSSFFADVNLLAWIPHKTVIYRGYNQSRLLAEQVARLLHCDICPEGCLRKNRKTMSQTRFHDFQDKKKNIEGAFTADNPLLFEGKNVLIIDDVMTTGNTINELGRVIKPFKPHTIKALTIALAHGPEGSSA